MRSRAGARVAGAMLAATALVSQLPAALRASGVALTPLSTGTEQDRSDHRPVVCVHGFASSPGSWRPLGDRLVDEGFSSVHTLSYNTLTCDLSTAARALAWTTRRLLRESGHDYVHLVGHSLGGLLVRASTERFGLWPHVGGLVMVATPHGGSPWSRLAPGPNRSWMLPRPAILPELSLGHDTGSPTYLNYYCPYDAVVPSASALLRQPGVHNYVLPGVGHLGAAAAPSLLAVLPDQLRSVEAHRAGQPVPGAPMRPRAVSTLERCAPAPMASLA